MFLSRCYAFAVFGVVALCFILALLISAPQHITLLSGGLSDIVGTIGCTVDNFPQCSQMPWLQWVICGACQSWGTVLPCALLS